MRSRNANGDISITLEDVEYTSLYRGKRHYELSNHLGNVQVVVSDKRISVCDSELEVAYFKADVLSAMDYYPGGMLLPERQWYAGNDSALAINGFNGMRNDHEINGHGNALDFGARIYDSRLVRWLSLDPLMSKYPTWSPYAYVKNCPILFQDLDGKDLWIGGNREQAIKDIYSLVPTEYHSRIKIAEDGKITIDLTVESGQAIPMQNETEYADAGLQLLVNLTTATEKYLYMAADDKYTTNVKNPVSGSIVERKKNINNDPNGVDNISTTKRYATTPTQKLEGASAERPSGGYDGMVVIDSDWQPTEKGEPKPRSSVVFHELWENYERTTNKLPYGTPVYENGQAKMDGLNVVWDKAKEKDGAHGKASAAEENFHEKSKYPGAADTR